ncbi:MAG: hypothetical protein ACRDYB_17105, partial [Acidimicrobiales bacterium]
MSSGLDRVREVARKDKDVRFTALLHHVDLNRLRAAYGAIRPLAAPGVDNTTWDSYGVNGHEKVRTGGHENSALVATRSPQSSLKHSPEDPLDRSWWA